MKLKEMAGINDQFYVYLFTSHPSLIGITTLSHKMCVFPVILGAMLTNPLWLDSLFDDFNSRVASLVNMLITLDQEIKWHTLMSFQPQVLHTTYDKIIHQ